MDCQTNVDWTYADTQPSEMINSNPAITCLCPHMAYTIYPLQHKSVGKMSILLNFSFSRRWILSSGKWLREISLVAVHNVSQTSDTSIFRFEDALSKEQELACIYIATVVRTSNQIQLISSGNVYIIRLPLILNFMEICSVASMDITCRQTDGHRRANI
jgi:hypothetical protein